MGPELGLGGLAPHEDPEKSAEFMMYTYKVGYEAARHRALQLIPRDSSATLLNHSSSLPGTDCCVVLLPIDSLLLHRLGLGLTQ
jgi:hypothetical protein